MTKVGWLSYADACNPNKDKDIENDLERQSNYYEASVGIQNPGNKRTLDELKTDDELLELLENLEGFAPVEMEVYEDHIHESFDITAYFDNEEDCINCAAVHSGGSYCSPSTDIGWHTAEVVKIDR